MNGQQWIVYHCAPPSPDPGGTVSNPTYDL